MLLDPSSAHILVSNTSSFWLATRVLLETLLWASSPLAALHLVVFENVGVLLRQVGAYGKKEPYSDNAFIDSLHLLYKRHLRSIWTTADRVIAIGPHP